MKKIGKFIIWLILGVLSLCGILFIALVVYYYPVIDRLYIRPCYYYPQAFSDC